MSTGDFSEALGALLCPDAPGLSATTVTRLKATWEADYEAWRTRSLVGNEYVYVWADGVYFNIRLESPGNDRQCILVLIGATRRTKGCGSRLACLTMVFKLVCSAERHWRALNAAALIPEVSEGVQFIDGVRKQAA